MTQTYQANDISILITCYKEGDLLLRAVDSVLQQSVQGFEVLIINDCSPDPRTNEICQELSNEGIKVIIRSENGGLSAARNTGFDIMTGKIAMPLDADDTLPLDAVSHTLEAMNETPDADMVFGDYILVQDDSEHSERIVCADLTSPEMLLDPHKLARNWKLIGTSPCTKRIWKKINGYSLDFSNSVQDVDFWRRAMLNGINGKYTPNVLYHWYRGDGGMNNSVTEEQYLPLRMASLPFYDRFHPEYGKEMRQYIYRYYSARLMYAELTTFISKEESFFSKIQVLKARIMRFKLLYKILRTLKNRFITFIFRPTDNINNSTK
jgi:glycosyltransferase involved in cell wall biosynthesis